MIESWKASLNNGTKVGAIITELPKASDSLNHNLVLTKLKAYGFDNNSVQSFRSYISNRYQHCKTNNSFSRWRWKRVLAGFPQGSIAGPLFFNIFINDIFLFLPKSEFANYADGSTVYSSDKNINNIIS